jgi:phosphatidylglycerol:prolipoprotein diacylglycerol transferase
VILALALAAALVLTRWLWRRAQRTEEHLFDLTFWVVLAGFIGARLYHVVNEWPTYAAHPFEIFAVWHGGLAIHGALLFGALTVWWFVRRRKLPFASTLDLLAPGVALGQAIGRFGNYVNQELFGRPTQLPWGLPVDELHRPPGYESFNTFHPTFLYESLGDVTLALGLTFWLVKGKPKPGTVILTYLAFSSFLRAATELLRIDRVPVIADVRLPLIVSLLLAVSATAWLIILQRRTSPHL